jgi:proton glutamate symport protein
MMDKESWYRTKINYYIHHMKIFKSLYTVFWYVVAFLHIGLVFFMESNLPGFDPTAFKIIRYLLIAFLFLIAFKRKKLSLWIFSSMILGVEVGMDFPAFSLEMERFGKIFLRLIKTLVAPLIFATLVIGIGFYKYISSRCWCESRSTLARHGEIC